MNTMTDIRTELLQLAMDLRWAWIEPMRRPFAMLNPEVWVGSNENPIAVLEATTDDYLEHRLQEQQFQATLERAFTAMEHDDSRQRWFERAAHGNEQSMQVAYVCSEFAIHECMQQYSGGLGVLAGDHLKSCADLGIPLTGFGLLYRQGYYQQEFRKDGSTRVVEPQWQFEDLPICETDELIEIPIGRSIVDARINHICVGHVDLYLLDTDLDSNRMRDRELTRGLYRGDSDLRLRQQVLLGVGAVLAADAMGIEPTVWHLNEGHAAFCGVERVARLVEAGVDRDAAECRVAETTVFTTHTPVPAGHDRYDLDRCAEVMRPTLSRGGMGKRDLARLGQEGDDGPLCMTVLAMRLARHVNGVAALHGEVSRAMWTDVYGCEPDDVPIRHITNGVHPATWMPPIAAEFWQREIGLRPRRSVPRCETWTKATIADPQAFWAMRQTLRSRLVQDARERLGVDVRWRGAEPRGNPRARDPFPPLGATPCILGWFSHREMVPIKFHSIH